MQRSATWRRRTAVVWTVFVMLSVVAIGDRGVAAAAADDLTLVVTPSTELELVQKVTYTVNGLPDGANPAIVVVQCPTGGPISQADCGYAYLGGYSGPNTVTVLETYEANGGRSVACNRQPDGCSLVVVVGLDGVHVQLSAPLSFVGNDQPGLDHDAPAAVPPGTTAAVTGWNLAPGPARVGLCNGAGVTATNFDDHCGQQRDVTVAADGTLAAEIVASNPVVRPDGTTLGCEDACTIGLLDAAGTVVLSENTVDVADPVVTAGVDSATVGDLVPVAATGLGHIAGQTVRFAMCTNPVALTGQCDAPVSAVVDAQGRVAAVLRAPRYAGIARCFFGRCSTAVFLGDEPSANLSGYDEVAVADDPTLGLEPSTDLFDGDAITLRTELVDGATYRLVRCRPNAVLTPAQCEDRTAAPAVTADAVGRITTTMPAAQWIRTGKGPAYCRDSCTIALIDEGLSSTASIASKIVGTYAMNAGSAPSVAPATGLTDGQTVRYTVEGLQPTYVGPPSLFASGGWSLVQCDASVKSATGQVTLMGVFQSCGFPPGGGAVDVTASSLDREVAVVRSLPRFLGGTTDCGASPGACLVGLTRLEVDGSISHHLAPISFG